MCAHMRACKLQASIARVKYIPPAMTMRMFALTILGVRINASGTSIEYTSARHVTAVVHTNPPPSKRHAKLARRGGRTRVYHMF